MTEDKFYFKKVIAANRYSTEQEVMTERGIIFLIQELRKVAHIPLKVNKTDNSKMSVSPTYIS